MFFLFLSYFLSTGQAISINVTNGIFYSPTHKMPVLSCHIEETDNVIFDWSARGFSITSRYVQVVSTESSTSLEFIFVDDSMLGDIYKCLVFNQHKILLGSKKVTLYAKPQVSIKMQENSIYAWQHSDVIMVCTFWGNPFPKSRWATKTIDYLNDKSEKLTPYKSSMTFILKNVTRANTGVYICQSVNSIGDTHLACNLRVRDYLSWGIPLAITLGEFLIIVTVILTSKGWKKWMGKDKGRHH